MTRLKKLLWLLLWFSLGCATYWLLLRPGLLVIGDLLIEFMNTPISLPTAIIFATGAVTGLVAVHVMYLRFTLANMEETLREIRMDLIKTKYDVREILKREMRDG